MFFLLQTGQILLDLVLLIPFFWCFEPFYFTCPLVPEIIVILAWHFRCVQCMHSNVDVWCTLTLDKKIKELPENLSSPDFTCGQSFTSFLYEDKIFREFPFFASSFQNMFCEILWLTLRKKLAISYRLNFYLSKNTQVYWVIMGLCRSIFNAWKMRLIFAWLTFTLCSCKVVVKGAFKPTFWFVVCWFFKHDIWKCCEKMWPNVILLWIAAIFHSFLFFLNLVFFIEILRLYPKVIVF